MIEDISQHQLHDMQQKLEKDLQRIKELGWMLVKLPPVRASHGIWCIAIELLRTRRRVMRLENEIAEAQKLLAVQMANAPGVVLPFPGRPQ